jgi:beta-glucosidase
VQTSTPDGETWRDPDRPAHERVGALLAAMSAPDKIALALSDFAALAHLGLPPLVYTDSGNGVREAPGVTAFPVALALAATFDVDLAEAYGAAIGREARAAGRNVLLGPSVDIVRTPLGGRAAESFGEDPCLAGALVARAVRGVQRAHVVAMPKHFVANNQEYLRTGSGSVTDRGPAIDVVVSDRALREIYLPPVRRALLDGGALSVMGSYNRVGGTYVCQSPRLLSILKDEWEWPGFVAPDFMFAVRDDLEAALAGLDIAALDGAGGRTADDFTSGRIPADRLEDIARRILYGMFAGGLFDHPLPARPDPEPSTPEHVDLARRVAADATVLLVNRDGILPLSPDLGSLALAGTAGEDALYVISGSGSVVVSRDRVRTALAGLRARAGDGVTVAFAQGSSGDTRLPLLSGEVLSPATGAGPGLHAEYWTGVRPAPDAPSAYATVEAAVDVRGTPEKLTNPWCARWTGTLTPRAGGPHRFSLTFAGSAELHVDGKPVAVGYREAECLAGGHEVPMQAVVDLEAGRPVDIRVEYGTGPAIDLSTWHPVDQFGETRPRAMEPGIQLGWQEPDARLAAAAALAADSDVSVVIVGAASGEGMDRASLALPGDQDALVAAVAAANPRTVVVLNTPGPVLMPWLDDVAAVVQVWYPGEQFGEALAAVLFGDVDPGGRLPVTFPATPRQGPARRPEQYPGVDGVVHYDEETLVGYRFFDVHDQSPLFAFGHGLSYGTYRYDDLSVSADSGTVTVAVTVTNTGPRAGTEVVQVYVAAPAGPTPALKGFGKVGLSPGESAPVLVHIGVDDLRGYDPTDGWTLVPGRYDVAVGASSRDIRLRGSIGL